MYSLLYIPLPCPCQLLALHTSASRGRRWSQQLSTVPNILRLRRHDELHARRRGVIRRGVERWAHVECGLRATRIRAHCCTGHEREGGYRACTLSGTERIHVQSEYTWCVPVHTVPSGTVGLCQNKNSFCGRRLVTGSCVIRETTQTGCPWSGLGRAFLYLSIYLSISIYRENNVLAPAGRPSPARGVDCLCRLGILCVCLTAVYAVRLCWLSSHFRARSSSRVVASTTYNNSQLLGGLPSSVRPRGSKLEPHWQSAGP